ncbi:M1 family metallopeptidase [Lysobacter niastensis]|uniref:Aminopeptidase n=1 Tax=Lysobacter niastensis TaxID=380629 RepID=A0ABS0B9D4_9GAMM|nr:M1 family metallopeptidase [Lysobacter niastensis]MBF6023715.1 M1 family metallopeptidase [Lysobacter niastensis]
MRRFLVTAIALALAGGSAAALAQTAGTLPSLQAQATTQLPRNVVPTHYDVALVPHAQSLSYDGRVTITLDVLEPTRTITLNQLDMTFASVRLAPASGKAKFAAPKVVVDNDAQTATFTFAEPVPAGSYRLSIDYAGKIGTQANGLFAIDYDTKGGRKRALFTQFENSDARRMIPSWDEPSHKATFTLEATVPANEMAVSNMPATSTEELGNGNKRIRFAQSPKMSTYLMFFSVGDFERATATTDGVEVGVVTQKGMLPQAQFALDSSQAVLREYHDYFGVPYPLPKLDNVASPGRSQFFGAMENWGAIFTFEYTLLLDPTISTQSDKQSVFSVAAHEIAHQWFGNLVTMNWWDDLWLNEGFASWMEGRTTEKLHPEWNTALSSVGVRARAMSLDAVATTHPVVQHVETVEQASQAFDSITYSKGEAVIRMLEGYVGAEAWRDGVRSYIKGHAYGNTVSDDLWRQIEAAAGKPVTAIAHDFTLQPGVPLIRVEQATCKGGRTTLTLAQGEFTKDRPGKAPLSWRVPVIAQVAGSQEAARTVVEGGRATLDVPGCGPVVVNAGQTGYYRTLYAPQQFKSLSGGFAKLAPIDQLGVMDDTWAQGWAGLQPASDYLDLVKATPRDADPQIWGDIASSLGSLDDYYRGDATRQTRFRKFAIAQLSPVLARIGWDEKAGEADPVKILRTQLIANLGELGDSVVIAEARRRHAANDMPPALRKTILSVVAHHADSATWDRLRAQAQAEKTPLVKDELYGLLSSAEDDALARRALELALTDEPGATNSASMIATVAYQHPDLAFDFAVAHRAQVDGKVDSTSRSRYYPALANRSLDPSMTGKIRAYADAHVAAGSRRASETAIADVQYRIKVRSERLPAVDAWLQAHGG